MVKKIILITILILLLPLLRAEAAAITSWKYHFLNDPDARQVANNIASLQREMNLENDPIQQFIAGMNGRVMSIIQQGIINEMLDENQDASGQYDIGDLNVVIIEDQQTGVVTIVLTNTETGEVTEIEYSTSEWPTDFDY